MISNQFLNEEGFLVKPDSFLDDALEKIRFETPIRESSEDLLRVCLKALDDFETGKKWCESDSFDRIRESLKKMRDALAKYQVGSVPFHSQILNQASLVFRMFLAKLQKRYGDKMTVIRSTIYRWNRAVGNLNMTLCGECKQATWLEALSGNFEKIDSQLRKLAESLDAQENLELHPDAAPATDASMKVAVNEVVEELWERAIEELKAAANHTKRRGKFLPLTRETCQKYWEIGQGIPAIMNGCNTRPRYDLVFEYFKIKLAELDIKNADEFKAAINAQHQVEYRKRKDDLEKKKGL